MTQQIPVADAAATGTDQEDGTRAVAADLAYKRLAIVNIAFWGRPGEPGWVLVDAGLPGSTGIIRRAAAERFGTHPPAAILLTHGHFDHTGALVTLAQEWQAPVYAHPLEHPYLDGRSSYPPPDPWVGGGVMALISPTFPRGPVDVGSALRALPEDGSLPFMPGWRWLHTPGHAPGHVSLWREADRLLMAGDAVITTAQEAAYGAITQETELHGPPRYYTPDWEAARDSARRLAALEPEILVTGHGQALQGAGMRAALHRLARDFDTVAVPKKGRYVGHAARAEDGSAYR
ncbi:MBL fold metallo-hydrolase [Roseomonas sp. E05]|uniref:MBL fold metallo-hydrolase n=1 Tax=Roseomonas sp. E05 TaxID=3046310 RepID=UPI0024B91FEC|nr:MBL fold metallo-hydrolase [Roseomonas sp. E05]MDJ0388460.1 MBL fold metallo-hydrolase [Roseomonas sp. E05]